VLSVNEGNVSSCITTLCSCYSESAFTLTLQHELPSWLTTLLVSLHTEVLPAFTLFTLVRVLASGLLIVLAS
jgi:hypothetical protein